MIPVEASDLNTLVIEVERQTAEVEDLFGSLEEEAKGWRSGPTTWSIAAHVAHLCIVNGAYVEALDSCVRQAGAKDITGDGPYRHPWLAKWFSRSMEPPPKPRLKTAKKMIPDPNAEAGSTLAEFVQLQSEWLRLMSAARGLDLGKARFSSPFLRLLRLSLGTGFAVILAHNRRHLWLIREVMRHPDFPRSASGSGI